LRDHFGTELKNAINQLAREASSAKTLSRWLGVIFLKPDNSQELRQTLLI
jgi:hypothetical protein